MTAQGKIKDGDKVKAPTGLDLLRAPPGLPPDSADRPGGGGDVGADDE